LERETGIEPATFSLGSWLQIENKEIHASGFQDSEVKQGLELAVDPVRKQIKALCKGAEISADHDPIHADQVCHQLLRDAKPLLEGLDCLLPASHPTREVAHDDVADRTLRCQVRFAKKTNDWKQSVLLLEQALAIASSESLRKELNEQLEAVRRNAETGDDFCGSGYYDAPSPLIERMEEARQAADRHEYDKAIQSLKNVISGTAGLTVSASHLPLVKKALAYCLGCRAVRSVNSSINEFSEFDSTVITAIRDRAKRDQINNTSWFCAKMGTIPQYTSCDCMACGTTIYSRYTILTGQC